MSEIEPDPWEPKFLLKEAHEAILTDTRNERIEGQCLKFIVPAKVMHGLMETLLAQEQRAIRAERVVKAIVGLCVPGVDSSAVRELIELSGVIASVADKVNQITQV